MKKISKLKQVEAVAYLKGYKEGYRVGVNESVLSQLTQNQIRAIIGLTPIADLNVHDLLVNSKGADTED